MSFVSLFINETDSAATMNGTRLTLRTPLVLCTPAYLAERDAREMNLHRRIAELEARP